MEDINKELLKILSRETTDKEKLNLFKKLEKIAEILFGVKISVGMSGYDSSYYNKGNHRIGISFYEYPYDQCLDNISHFNIISRREMEKIPVLFSFFHELSHALTITDDDIHNYRKYYFINCSDNGHRKFPYEKLADNLAYELLSKNYDSVIKILLGKKIRKNKKNIINSNINISNQYKKKYIHNKVFWRYMGNSIINKILIKYM